VTGKFPVDAPIEKVINALEHLGFQVVRRGNHSMHILQTDSGIPIKSFDPSLWNLKLFGTYEKLLPVFSYRYHELNASRGK
jgi:hypothetical protein